MAGSYHKQVFDVFVSFKIPDEEQVQSEQFGPVAQ